MLPKTSKGIFHTCSYPITLHGRVVFCLKPHLLCLHRRKMTEILPIRRKTLSNQSICLYLQAVYGTTQTHPWKDKPVLWSPQSSTPAKKWCATAISLYRKSFPSICITNMSFSISTCMRRDSISRIIYSSEQRYAVFFRTTCDVRM